MVSVRSACFACDAEMSLAGVCHACLPVSFENHVHCRRKTAGQGNNRAEALDDLLRSQADDLPTRNAANSDVDDGRAPAAQPAGNPGGALPAPRDSTDGRGRGGATAASKAAAEAAGNTEEGQDLPGLGAVGGVGDAAQLCDSEDEETEGQEGLHRLPRRCNNAVIASSSSEDELPLGLHRQPRSTGEASTCRWY